jgi:hypothetical protein
MLEAGNSKVMELTPAPALLIISSLGLSMPSGPMSYCVAVISIRITFCCR